MRLLLLTALAACGLQAEIRGAALVQNPKPVILTWGTQLLSWPLDGGKPTVLLDHTDFGHGGCIADVDNDGLDDLLVMERPEASQFLWLKAPSWTSHVIERNTDFQDCLPFEIDGKRGVIFPHLDSQVRFYSFPDFHYWELYSIYTASRQGGLLSHDVDGDGLLDLFVGDYWMRNPGALGVAWRLFAVNTFHETPDAALAALGMWRGRDQKEERLIWAESRAEEARVVVYSPPEDRKQMWIENRLPPLKQPRSVVVLPEQGVFIGHANGVALESPQGEGWRRTSLGRGFPVIQLIQWRGNVIAVSPERLLWVYPLR